MSKISDGLYNKLIKKEKLQETWLTDAGLGTAQDTASFAGTIANLASTVVPGGKLANILHKVGVAGSVAATAINMTRSELDRTGLVPSKTGNLDTQQQMLLGKTIGLVSKGPKISLKPMSRREFILAKQSARGKYGHLDKAQRDAMVTHDLGALKYDYSAKGKRIKTPVGKAPTYSDIFPKLLQNKIDASSSKNREGLSNIVNYGMFSGIGGNKNPALMMGSILGGRSGSPIDDIAIALGSSESGRHAADWISSATGLPSIPGISAKLTRKEPYEVERAFELSKSPTALDLIYAANSRRQGG